YPKPTRGLDCFGAHAPRHDDISIAVATPGSSNRKRLPNPSVSNDARRSCALWRKCAQPSVCSGTISASGKARAVSIVSLVSMVRWNGPRVCAAPANGSTRPHLKRRAISEDAIEPCRVAADIDRRMILPAGHEADHLA